jgi:hypothetical protein
VINYRINHGFKFWTGFEAMAGSMADYWLKVIIKKER